jgi:serine/threonine-protein kinase RsbW
MRMSSHPAGEERNEPVLRLAGDLDFRTAGPTRTALLQALGQESTGLVVDLSAVGFIDSSGLAVLYEATRLVEPSGGRIRLRGLDIHLHRLLHIIGLAERFDLEAPVAARRAGPATIAGATPIGQTYRLPGEAASVPLIRTYVGVVAREMGFSEAGVRDILIAVSEAATNALKHGSPQGDQDEIAVRCHFEAERLVIEVMDRGKGFDPLSVPVPVAEQMREGGMGIFFMRTLMDEVSFDCGSGGTTVRLVKCRR